MSTISPQRNNGYLFIIFISTGGFVIMLNAYTF
jgi:hypothetical protein